MRAGFAPQFGELKGKFPSNPTWKKLKELGTELWLDTGNIQRSNDRTEFSAIDRQHALNKEIQRGVYDDTIKEAARLRTRSPARGNANWNCSSSTRGTVSNWWNALTRTFPLKNTQI